MGWTLTTRDSMGRVTSAAHYAGGTQPVPWGSNSTSTGTVTTSYNGATTTVTDEAGNAHVNTVDGLGRLTSVQEANGTTTTYVYDALNNLTGVSMGGQIRVFGYSSLSRLLSAQNPESGTINYAYDANGNLTGKTDARSVSATMTYDGLNRIKTKTYSDGTPAVTYTYDQTGDAKGTLYSVVSGADSTVYTHDAVGRAVTSTQTTANTAYQLFKYVYSLSDQLQQLTYPSGRSVSYGFDSADRVTTVAGALNGQSTPYTASAIAYTAAGGFSSVPLAKITESYSWNDRLQQTGITAGSLLTLHFYPCDNGQTACSNNNGNIWRENIQNVGLPKAGVTQAYGYDNLNRLTASSEGVTPNTTGNWNRTYGYDIYGNGWASANSVLYLDPTTPTVSTNFDANNRLLVDNASYDSAGNQKAIAGFTNTFDAENRLATSTLNGVTTTYTYDGEGRRVQKATGSSTTTYVYDAQGQLTAEYATAPPPAPCATCYLTADHLGSTRMVTDGNGNPVSCHDYVPFGEEIPAGVGSRSSLYYPPSPLAINDTVTEKFTGKERDQETGLDYFGARYLSSPQGRWTSPDWSEKPQPVPYADLKDPQTLNLYAYVRNNPLSRSDLDGHCTDDQGKEHGFWWCAGHALGLIQTEKEKADVARNFFDINPTKDQNGNLIDPSKMSNADVIQAFQDYNHGRRDQIEAMAIATVGDRAAGVYVNLLDASGQTHVLEGDATGGGHRAGTGIPGKSEFPASWSDDKILHYISDVATASNSIVTKQGNTTLIEGSREGVQIRVVERDGRIVSAYPTNTPRNP